MFLDLLLVHRQDKYSCFKWILPAWMASIENPNISMYCLLHYQPNWKGLHVQSMMLICDTIPPLHNSIWGSVVTNCFSFRGSITYYYLEFYLLPKKKIIPLPLIVGGNCIQQELTYRHKQALVSQYLTWYTELTPDCDHIYF